MDPGSLQDMIGTDCYEAALGYVRRKAVVQQTWIPGQNALVGLVHGRFGEFYTPTVYFSRQGPMLEVRGAQCNCDARYACEHAAALLVSAVEGEADATGMPAAPRQARRPPSWDSSLESLLAAGPDAGRAGETTLAIELTLVAEASLGQLQRQPRPRSFPAAGAAPTPTPARSPVRLMARLVQPGKNGGWIGGTLSWVKLDGYGYFGGYPAAQVRLLRELLALYRARVDQAHYYYSRGNERSIELSAFESSRLWPLLDEAGQAGLQLVYGHKLGALERYREARLCLDVTQAESGGELAITPMIRLDGPDSEDADAQGAVPVRFIGAEGHGVVYLDQAEAQRSADPGSWRFRLARLGQAVPTQLQEMALAGQRLTVPAAEYTRFRDQFYPRLRQMAPVISSDGSFTPPVISDPTLVLRASYGDGHDVQVDWEWAYQVGDSRLRAELHEEVPGEVGYRDLAAEQAVLDSLRLGGLPGDPALVPSSRLGGLDTMRFTTEVLPLLSGQPGMAVEVTGQPADYREAGDSLRIGVSTGEVAGEVDWFDLGVTITVEGREVPFTDVFTALSRGELHVLLPDGAYFSLDKPELRQLARLIEEARTLQEDTGGPLRISRFQAGLWEELAALGVVGRQARAWQQQVQGLLEASEAGGISGSERGQPPDTLRARLRPYQLDGFRWLAFLWKHSLGGILADDMGLGKTLETLALICHARQAAPASAPFLVVAPTSVVPNWVAETARFAPGLKVVTITDTLARSGADLANVITGADIVVTSYTLLRLDFGAHLAAEWSGLILDEAQYTKNHQSKIYQCARRLRAPFKVAITGTPMENNLMELWSLLSITAPGLFPNPARFRDYYARPIERQGDAELLAQLRRRIRPLLKRRTKEQVAADLPEKQEQVLEVELHPRHRKLYQTHLQRERQKVLGLIDDMDANRFTILASLTRLRQLSLHAALVDSAQADLPCSKIDTLLDQITDVAASGHRALVFSQFTGFLAYVRERLDAAGIPYCYLDGKTRDRAAVLGRFKDGTDPVFLISLKAGGFGLNLTEADYCFLLDPWWNPATETQAIDRTHRIGQTRNVMVYRLIAKDTIEEKVMALKARKAELFSSVIDDGNAFGGSLDADDIRGLLA
jgi:SNF2-related domain/Helicase conserved C-terminal domain